MLRKSLIIGTVLVAILNTGCSTMAGGHKKKDMTFTSVPAGAMVSSGERGDLGVTPLTVAISPGDSGHFVFTKEGYENKSIQLKKSINSKSHGNIIFLPLYPVGKLVDQMTDADQKFDTDKVHVELEPVKTEAV